MNDKGSKQETKPMVDVCWAKTPPFAKLRQMTKIKKFFYPISLARNYLNSYSPISAILTSFVIFTLFKESTNIVRS